MKKQGIHVVPRGDKWAVERGGASRASKIVETQREAIVVGRISQKKAGPSC
jgi:Uncharacterized protein conserved in bacteria (DUF2188)